MDTRVFVEDNERIRNFIQLTYITLSSTGAVPLRRLEEAYRSMGPIIHERANDDALDSSALCYAALRLPPCVTGVRKIFLGQSETILEEGGVPMSAWTEVTARARRRRYLYDGKDTLICFIASKSDVDDVIPSLLALQIEWNKAHRILAKAELPDTFPAEPEQREAAVARLLETTRDDARKLCGAFGDRLPETMAAMRREPMDLYVRNFEASYCRYRRETETWWRQIQTQCPDIEHRPVYFVSSNTHSLINVLSGFAEEHEDEILRFAEKDPELAEFARRNIDANENLGPRPSDQAAPAGIETVVRGNRRANLLYYLLMRYEQQDATGAVTERRIAHEERVGVRRISGEKTLDIPTQVIDLRLLSTACFPDEKCARWSAFAGTDAMVLNIDYPLGRTAYFILNKLAEHVPRIRGVYVIGKAASLFADRGDVLIPSSIVDQHTRNQYFFENCIRVRDVEPFLDGAVHSIYDNQKAVTVLGTFLQNREMLNQFLAAGVTDLEMEAGPYLAAIYEIAKPKRYPENEVLSLRLNDIDLGIVHYVSDNPLSGRHLSTRLEQDGVDATYAATRAVLVRMLTREATRAAEP